MVWCIFSVIIIDVVRRGVLLTTTMLFIRIPMTMAKNEEKWKKSREDGCPPPAVMMVGVGGGRFVGQAPPLLGSSRALQQSACSSLTELLFLLRSKKVSIAAGNRTRGLRVLRDCVLGRTSQPSRMGGGDFQVSVGCPTCTTKPL